MTNYSLWRGRSTDFYEDLKKKINMQYLTEYSEKRFVSEFFHTTHTTTTNSIHFLLLEPTKQKTKRLVNSI